jgi:hypothetical protein
LKIKRKTSFLVSGGQSGPFGRTVRGLLVFILYLSFWQKISRKCASGRTVRRDQVDGPRGSTDDPLFVTERGAARWTGRTVRCQPADSPRGLGGRSAWPWRTVRPAQQAVTPTVVFAFLPLEFKRGQSARASRTVREARVLCLTASNGKGEYLYSKPGVGESLLAL